MSNHNDTIHYWYLTARNWIRYPIYNYRRAKKLRAFPAVGDMIRYHGEAYKVINIDRDTEDVRIETGIWVSWLHCCTPFNSRESFSH